MTMTASPTITTARSSPKAAAEQPIDPAQARMPNQFSRNP